MYVRIIYAIIIGKKKCTELEKNENLKSKGEGLMIELELELQWHVIKTESPQVVRLPCVLP